MGLDMYLEGQTFNWTNWEHPEKDAKRDGFRIKGITLELGYWRKHPDLHGYIVETFAGGVDDCREIELSVENLQQILDATRTDKLPHTEGFFFGASQPEDKERTIEIISGAIKWLTDGDKPKTERKLEPIGAGMAVLAIKPEDYKDMKESRTVIYRASW